MKEFKLLFMINLPKLEGAADSLAGHFLHSLELLGLFLDSFLDLGSLEG